MGVGKLLHILVPNVCLIWDRAYVIDKGVQRDAGGSLFPGAHAKGYVEYIKERATQFQRLAASEGIPPAELAKAVETVHANQPRESFEGWAPSFSEPLAKIMDEVNYL